MSLIVEKFGGTSVADAQCVSNVAKIIKKTKDQSHDVDFVVYFADTKIRYYVHWICSDGIFLYQFSSGSTA